MISRLGRRDHGWFRIFWHDARREGNSGHLQVSGSILPTTNDDPQELTCFDFQVITATATGMSFTTADVLFVSSRGTMFGRALLHCRCRSTEPWTICLIFHILIIAYWDMVANKDLRTVASPVSSHPIRYWSCRCPTSFPSHYTSFAPSSD